MKAQMTKKIVVEFERVQLIRKQAKTHYVHCAGCNIDSEFVSIDVASRLFEISDEEMLRILKASNCHFRADENGKGDICLNSFLLSLKAAKDSYQIKRIS